MTKDNRTTTTYIEGDYVIDIVETETYFDAYLQRSDMAIKSQMFGVDKAEGITFDQYKEMIEGYLNSEIETYRMYFEE